MAGKGTRALLAAIVAVIAFATGPVGTGQAAPAVGFAPPVFVDMAKAGGEPGIIHSTRFGTLVYTSHEGTTHLDRTGVAGAGSVEQFLCPDVTTQDCYQNHVWIWTSEDHGKTWTPRNEGLGYTGFSDPDLTEDAGGTIYNTGIDLANDSVFSSQDGGRTWPHGTVQCHEGDRPWLAGGKAGEVFMTTDADTTSGTQHELFHSSNSADSCDSNGIADNGGWQKKGSYSGFGKGIYDRFDGSYIEPAQFRNDDGSFGVGISRLPHASASFPAATAKFQPQEVVSGTSVFGPFGAPEVVSMDAAENLYFAWDTDERDPGGKGGCNQVQSQPVVGGGPTPLPNHVMLEIGKHVGPGQWQWEPPISLAHQGSARVLWPWSVAGSAGNLSVVWYQMDKMVDPDCDLYNSNSVPDVNTYIYEAHITNATDPATRAITVTNASGRAIHQGGICNSGTTCVATGQDRRLGDYFTNAIDEHGCVVIASGDTTIPDSITGQPRVTSLPVFIQQSSGPGLTGQQCGSTTTAVAPAAPAGAVQAATGTPDTARGPAIPARLLVAALLVAVLIVAAALAPRRRARS